LHKPGACLPETISNRGSPNNRSFILDPTPRSLLSCPRRRASSLQGSAWIPVFTGMTVVHKRSFMQLQG
jgi:hypothetical protein